MQADQQMSNGDYMHYFQHKPEHQYPANTTILFIHGNMSSLDWWLPTIKAILQKQPNIHMIAIDQLGFGSSTYLNRCTRMQDWANKVYQFCCLKNLTRIIAIGWSFGGGVVMKLAELYKDLIIKILLTASVPYDGLKFETSNGKLLKQQSELLSSSKIQFTINIIQEQNHNLMGQIFQSVLFNKMKYQGWLVDTALKQKSYIDVLQSIAKLEIDVSKITTQVLIIHGGQDLIIGVDLIRQTCKLLNSKLQVWQNNAHMIPLQDVNRYADRVLQYIFQQ